MSLSLPAPRRTPADGGARPVLAPLLERAVAGLLGAYVFVQWFGPPVLAAGPSWALWPSLADLLLWGALGLGLFYRRSPAPEHRAVWRALLLVGGLCLLSFGLLLALRDGHFGVAVPFGLFQLYKLAQTLAAFWLVSRLPLAGSASLGLRRRWGQLALLSFWLMVVGVVWTTVSSWLPDTLGQVLPRGQGVAGPWEGFYRHYELGLGTIGYNHGHVAAMVLLGGALALLLRPGRWTPWVLGGILVASFLSGSRAGFAGAALFVLLQGFRTPVLATLALTVLAAGAVAASPWLGAELDGLIARQSTLLEATDAGNLAGRTDIWAAYLASLRDEPLRLLIGSGFGSGMGNIGAYAHLLPLQVLYETGLAGLAILGLLFGLLFARLRQAGTHAAGVATHLLAALWLTALTTDTFYPNSAFGSFLPLLALTLALALARSPRPFPS
ncbi:O-antigen ligase family protein [Deinococcus murrayi]|uniref:O-antigen ligase family protein n=1 Tax=Deinococcus murrayi TaxID=68910 RepID=UPI0005572604|nr:O-antigen ligase family protein [Deinococcus murrayi]